MLTFENVAYQLVSFKENNYCEVTSLGHHVVVGSDKEPPNSGLKNVNHFQQFHFRFSFSWPENHTCSSLYKFYPCLQLHQLLPRFFNYFKGAGGACWSVGW